MVTFNLDPFSYVPRQTKTLLEWGAEVMVIDNKGKLPLHLVGQSASQKNRGKSNDIIKLLKSKMPADDDEGELQRKSITVFQAMNYFQRHVLGTCLVYISPLRAVAA